MFEERGLSFAPHAEFLDEIEAGHRQFLVRHEHRAGDLEGETTQREHELPLGVERRLGLKVGWFGDHERGSLRSLRAPPVGPRTPEHMRPGPNG